LSNNIYNYNNTNIKSNIILVIPHMGGGYCPRLY